MAELPRADTSFPRETLANTFAHKVFKRMYERDCRTSLLQIDVRHP